MVNQKELINPALEGQTTDRVKRNWVSTLRSHLSELTEVPPGDSDFILAVQSLRFAPYRILLSRDEGTKLLKEHALRHTVPDIFGSVTKTTGWKPNSPEVKYMTGVLFKSHILKRVEWLEERFAQFAAHQRTYRPARRLKEAKKLERTEISNLKRINSIITVNLGKIAADNFLDKPSGERYIEILRYLVTLSEYFRIDSERDRIKHQIGRHLKRGEINEAYDYLMQKLEDRDGPQEEAILLE